MRRGLLPAAVAILSLLPACAATAGGWGGVSAAGPYLDVGFSGPLLGVTSVCGYGYGVNADGDRIGGFGLALLPSAALGTGGAGGVLFGHEWWLGPLVIGFDLMGGVGGTAAGGGGYLVVCGEADIDVGIAVLPWMQLTAFFGYRTVGNLFPGATYSSISWGAPVLGLRLAWGGR